MFPAIQQVSIVLPFLPAVITGKEVRGLNARFSVYRYIPGALYGPHLDGAWPASGLDPVTGEYIYDSSLPDDPLWSQLTLYLSQPFALLFTLDHIGLRRSCSLKYLNDEFSNGLL